MAGKSKKQQTIAGMNDDKNEALKHALKAMEDQFGPGTIMRLGDQTKLEVETIPTGSIALDRALGVGGLPKGRLLSARIRSISPLPVVNSTFDSHLRRK